MKELNNVWKILIIFFYFTDTIGSFHTARSISLSTLYFSAKNYGWGWNDDEDTKTLNWTMNHQSLSTYFETKQLPICLIIYFCIMF